MSGISKPTKITGTAALFVEGNDEVNFFKAFLRHLKIDGVDVRSLGGKRRFKEAIPAAINTPGFSKVSVYAVIRDADNNADGAFDSVRNILRDIGQRYPAIKNTFSQGSPRVGVFIVPGDLDQGMLEDLCMNTVEGHWTIPFVDVFINGIKERTTFPAPSDLDAGSVESYQYPNNLSKARAKAFLAAQPHDLPNVGVAALASVWNFDHRCLDGLRSFLEQLARQ